MSLIAIIIILVLYILMLRKFGLPMLILGFLCKKLVWNLLATEQVTLWIKGYIIERTTSKLPNQLKPMQLQILVEYVHFEILISKTTNGQWQLHLRFYAKNTQEKTVRALLFTLLNKNKSEGEEHHTIDKRKNFNRKRDVSKSAFHDLAFLLCTEIWKECNQNLAEET